MRALLKSIHSTSYDTGSLSLYRRVLKRLNLSSRRGRVAQWTTRRSTEPKIAGSNPAVVDNIFISSNEKAQKNVIIKTQVDWKIQLSLSKQQK